MEGDGLIAIIHLMGNQIIDAFLCQFVHILQLQNFRIHLDGQSVRRSVYGKSRNEVMAKLREILQRIAREEYVPPQKITVGKWMDEWWRIYCLPSKKISTCTGYESTINLHIRPYLGRIELQELKPMQIQAAINQLVKEGKAPSTVRKAQTLLHCALEQAIINGMIIRKKTTDH